MDDQTLSFYVQCPKLKQQRIGKKLVIEYSNILMYDFRALSR